MIAALYVQTNGAYYGIDGVDPWDEDRDARLYDGPWPVVAHPPCNVWCIAAYPAITKGYIKAGDDGGCFQHALDVVRTCGGVLEHPAYTNAWKEYALLRPQRGGGWSKSLYDDGWVCEVDQAQYGHAATKNTWLYAVGCELPALIWGKYPNAKYRLRNIHNSSGNDRLPHLRGKSISATPEPFKQILIDMARSVEQQPNLQVVG